MSLLLRIKRKLRRTIGGNNETPTVQTNIEDVILDNPPPVEGQTNEPVQNFLGCREITSLIWNGPILRIEGYYYLDGVSIDKEDYVKKTLILVDSTMSKIEIPLKDVPITDIVKDEKVDMAYYWAGFSGNINFATINNEKPLNAESYTVYLRIEVEKIKNKKAQGFITLGNISKFLPDSFHSSAMEYFSAKQILKFNLLATYDLGVKTLRIQSSKLKDLSPEELDTTAIAKQGLLYKIVYTKIFRLMYFFFKILPVDEKKVLFASDSRTELSGNFKFVYDEMIRRDLPLKYRFMLKSSIQEKKSLKELIQLAYELATSKTILLDDFYPMVYPLKIRKKAELVQLWHAVGAFKTFGYSRIGRPGGPSLKSKNHRNYTKAIVSSKNVAKHYAEGFGIDKDFVVSTGIPRTDIFFDKEYQEQVRNDLYEQYPFMKEKKVIMFAPTFRGNGQSSAHYPMEVLNLERLYHELKDEYIFIFKIHPFVKNDFSIPYEYSDFFYDFSEYREINDLLFVTDLLITDYSSVCFEYALLNKPMLFFAYDIEQYVQKRDFYYNFRSFIPGPLVKNTQQIIEKIQTQDYKMEKIEPFIKYFFDDFDGKSSARVVDQIILAKDEEDDKK